MSWLLKKRAFHSVLNLKTHALNHISYTRKVLYPKLYTQTLHAMSLVILVCFVLRSIILVFISLVPSRVLLWLATLGVLVCLGLGGFRVSLCFGIPGAPLTRNSKAQFSGGFSGFRYRLWGFAPKLAQHACVRLACQTRMSL